MKKIFSTLIAIAITAALLTPCVGASKMTDSAVKVKLGDMLENEKKVGNTTKYYAFEVPEPGVLEVMVDSVLYGYGLDCTFYFNNKVLTVTEKEIGDGDRVFTVNCEKKGTYYLAANCWNYDGELYSVIPSFDKKALPEVVLTVPMKKGAKIDFSATRLNTKETVTWTSSKAAVATVTSKGAVTAKSKGTATIVGETESGLRIKYIVKVS